MTGNESGTLRIDDRVCWEAGDKLSVSTGETAIKDFYARAFQEWALGNLEGTAEEIFGLPFFWRTTECHVAVGVVITS
jgi:hypothetical protein